MCRFHRVMRAPPDIWWLLYFIWLPVHPGLSCLPNVFCRRRAHVIKSSSFYWRVEPTSTRRIVKVAHLWSTHAKSDATTLSEFSSTITTLSRTLRMSMVSTPLGCRHCRHHHFSYLSSSSLITSSNISSSSSPSSLSSSSLSIIAVAAVMDVQ